MSKSSSMRKPTTSDIMEWSFTLAVASMLVGGAAYCILRMFGQL